ncbi:MAG: hypothetical protein WBA35_09360 [Litorimonas sp.]
MKRPLPFTSTLPLLATAAAILQACGASNSPPTVNWTDHVQGGDTLLASELEREVTEAIQSGDCKSMQDWFDYSISRRQMATRVGRLESDHLTDFVDFYMREKMDCYDASGLLKTRGRLANVPS